jgi:hypothetical protein
LAHFALIPPFGQVRINRFITARSSDRVDLDQAVRASRMALDGDATVRVTRSTYTVTAMLLPFAHS